jgi:alkanesulfonate monooxygenase SsuD/methylene tetrahydromethanopterin reductase-like flavin-dependent oxidoreductase (luciferase family)
VTDRRGSRGDDPCPHTGSTAGRRGRIRRRERPAEGRTIRAVAAEAGRDLTGFGWYAFVFVNLDDDGDRARGEAARGLGGTYDQDLGRIVDRAAAAGTPTEVGRRLRDFVAAGARHLVLRPAPGSGDADAVVRRLLDEVLPEVRAHPLDQAPAR